MILESNSRWSVSMKSFFLQSVRVSLITLRINPPPHAV